MKTEYGIRFNHIDEWNEYSRSEAEAQIKVYGGVLIAREVSEPRVMSIRG